MRNWTSSSWQLTLLGLSSPCLSPFIMQLFFFFFLFIHREISSMNLPSFLFFCLLIYYYFQKPLPLYFLSLPFPHYPLFSFFLSLKHLYGQSPSEKQLSAGLRSIFSWFLRMVWAGGHSLFCPHVCPFGTSATAAPRLRAPRGRRGRVGSSCLLRQTQILGLRSLSSLLAPLHYFNCLVL